ncbi:hypothetical protein WHR41_08381 [Cladosporium halotolerans]|uniref:YDG domain-containing protein n=1 Tax=Cladosporium halotolerans TaxID=1052096 RepID=A0AB34KG24_9PEZI
MDEEKRKDPIWLEAYDRTKAEAARKSAMYEEKYYNQVKADFNKEAARKYAAVNASEASGENHQSPADSNDRSRRHSSATSESDDPLQGWGTRKYKIAKAPTNTKRQSSAAPSPVSRPFSAKPRQCSIAMKGSQATSPPQNETSANTAEGVRSRSGSGSIHNASTNVLPSRNKRAADGFPSQEGRAALPKIRKRSSVAPQSDLSVSRSGLPSAHVHRLDANRKPPQWYIDTKRPANGTRDPKHSDADSVISRLKSTIDQRERADALQETAALDGKIINMLHTLPFVTVNETLLKKHRILDNDRGLPRLFDAAFSKGIQWPYAIKADSEELYNKWCARMFATDLFRGINLGIKGRNSEGGADSLMEDYRQYRLMDPKQHGNGLLLNGAWFPSQLAALRDGAHGSSMSGITCAPGDGAYSVIMAGGKDTSGVQYPNEDQGKVVLYCGTDNIKDTNGPSAETKMMLENVRNGQPVRLLRSHNCPSDWAPEVGVRYDGLYSVTESECLDPSNAKRQRYRFKLVRCSGQGPIRDDRPTAQEKAAYEKDRVNRGR